MLTCAPFRDGTEKRETPVPGRLRDRHLAQVLEALIQYSAAGGELSLTSDGVDNRLVIAITIQDSHAYDERLRQIMLDGFSEDESPA